MSNEEISQKFKSQELDDMKDTGLMIPEEKPKRKSKVNLTGIKVVRIQSDDDSMNMSYGTRDKDQSQDSVTTVEEPIDIAEEEKIIQEIKKHFPNPTGHAFKGVSFRITNKVKGNYLNSGIQRFEEKKQAIPEVGIMHTRFK